MGFFTQTYCGKVAKEVGGQLHARGLRGNLLLLEFNNLFPLVSDRLAECGGGQRCDFAHLAKAYEEAIGNTLTPHILRTRFGHYNRYTEHTDMRSAVKDALTYVETPRETPVKESSVRTARSFRNAVIADLMAQGKLLRAPEFAKANNLSESTVYRNCDQYETVRVGSRILFFAGE